MPSCPVCHRPWLVCCLFVPRGWHGVLGVVRKPRAAAPTIVRHHTLMLCTKTCPTLLFRAGVATRRTPQYCGFFVDFTHSAINVGLSAWSQRSKLSSPFSFASVYCLCLASTTLDFPTLSYSWIGHGLQNGPMLVFSLWLSDFKTNTSFGFLIKKTRGSFFRKIKTELV